MYNTISTLPAIEVLVTRFVGDHFSAANQAKDALLNCFGIAENMIVEGAEAAAANSAGI